ncbi:DUF1778 domain-containing protein [Variovorax paradoxus]|uniref:type II toxin-antitoxin system TacA family antitoxin n=1 Tax=Variovorax paradoxus TaxID=34073 RepID=UPI003ECDDFCE
MTAILEHAQHTPSQQGRHARAAEARRAGAPEHKRAPQPAVKIKSVILKRRLECRVQEDVHQTLEWAARVSGRTVTDLVVAGALYEAQRTLENMNVIQMTREAQICFAELLVNPPELTEAFKKAEASHKRLIRST